MVFEDAFNILNSATPYNVELVLEDNQQLITKIPKSSQTFTILHPLYKSHSDNNLNQEKQAKQFPYKLTNPYKNMGKGIVIKTSQEQQTNQKIIKPERQNKNKKTTQHKEKLVEEEEKQTTAATTNSNFKKFGVQVLPMPIKKCAIETSIDEVDSSNEAIEDNIMIQAGNVSKNMRDESKFKRMKGKAPSPPPNQNMPDYSSDSDSNNTQITVYKNTIELSSNDITIHHNLPDELLSEEERKAASLDDLSKFESNSSKKIASLERTQSLDIFASDNIIQGHKRKGDKLDNFSTDEFSFSKNKEPRLSLAFDNLTNLPDTFNSLKKSTEWGIIGDALHNIALVEDVQIDKCLDSNQNEIQTKIAKVHQIDKPKIEEDNEIIDKQVLQNNTVIGEVKNPNIERSSQKIEKNVLKVKEIIPKIDENIEKLEENNSKVEENNSKSKNTNPKIEILNNNENTIKHEEENIRKTTEHVQKFNNISNIETNVLKNTIDTNNDTTELTGGPKKFEKEMFEKNYPVKKERTRNELYLRTDNDKIITKTNIKFEDQKNLNEVELSNSNEDEPILSEVVQNSNKIKVPCSIEDKNKGELMNGNNGIFKFNKCHIENDDIDDDETFMNETIEDETLDDEIFEDENIEFIELSLNDNNFDEKSNFIHINGVEVGDHAVEVNGEQMDLVYECNNIKINGNNDFKTGLTFELPDFDERNNEKNKLNDSQEFKKQLEYNVINGKNERNNDIREFKKELTNFNEIDGRTSDVQDLSKELLTFELERNDIPDGIDTSIITTLNKIHNQKLALDLSPRPVLKFSNDKLMYLNQDKDLLENNHYYDTNISDDVKVLKNYETEPKFSKVEVSKSKIPTSPPRISISKTSSNGKEEIVKPPKGKLSFPKLDDQKSYVTEIKINNNKNISKSHQNINQVDRNQSNQIDKSQFDRCQSQNDILSSPIKSKIPIKARSESNQNLRRQFSNSSSDGNYSPDASSGHTVKQLRKQFSNSDIQFNSRRQSLDNNRQIVGDEVKAIPQLRKQVSNCEIRMRPYEMKRSTEDGKSDLKFPENYRQLRRQFSNGGDSQIPTLDNRQIRRQFSNIERDILMK